MLSVEIADTPYSQAQGLMFRSHLHPDSGMIFVFRKPQKLSFWGVNTLVPLDIAFVKDDGKISKISTIHPLSDRSVVSNEDCTIAIEANLGYFGERRINIGDHINLERLSKETGIVRFTKRKDLAENVSKQKVSQVVENGNFVGLQRAVPHPNDESSQRIHELGRVVDEQGSLPVYDLEELIEALEDKFDDTTQEVETREEDALVEAPEVAPTEEEYPEFANPEQALSWAQQNQEVVRIFYRTKGGRDIQRRVHPHLQFTAKTTGNDIVVTYDETVKDIRAFVVSNIMYYDFAGQQFRPSFLVRGQTDNGQGTLNP